MNEGNLYRIKRIKYEIIPGGQYIVFCDTHKISSLVGGESALSTVEYLANKHNVESYGVLAQGCKVEYSNSNDKLKELTTEYQLISPKEFENFKPDASNTPQA